MPFLSHAGVSLRYDRTGNGPAVLFVHGWTANRTFWDHQVRALRDRHTVVTVDLRGHGESSPPRTGYSIAAMAADLEHLVRTLGVSRLAVVGWSMGGTLAQALALRMGDRVSALALVCTTAGGLSDPANALAQPERSAEMRAAVARDFREFVRGFAPLCFKDGAASPLVPWAIGQMQRTAPHAALACFEAFLAADHRERLGALTVPTVVVHGRHDKLLPLAAAEDLAGRIPGAELAVFDESGHAPFLEEPAAFNQALGRLLAAEPRPAPPAPPAGTDDKAAPPARPRRTTRRRS
jgi:3-oxoadipate enol-lactonase